jgi:hypothetical protein
MTENPGLEIYSWDQIGYRPLVFSHDWQLGSL